MASLKDLRRRIRATKSMQQIFKAMEMVAAAKLRRAHTRAQAATPYSQKIQAMLANLIAAADEIEHPLVQAREAKVTAIVVITADRGFAGAYNAAVLRAAEQRLRNAPPGSMRCIVVGRKGRDYLRRRGHAVLAAHTDLPGEVSVALAREITDDLIHRFVRGEIDRVDILYTHFVNAIVRRVLTETFLPIEAKTSAGAESAAASTIFEPDAAALFAELLPRYATAMLYAAMADSLASEHAARMVAMGSARKNAGELVDSLTLTRNRLRQAAITREISELVGGAEALN
jgi:F-type H+-transporting ATPase subunit gamma